MLTSLPQVRHPHRAHRAAHWPALGAWLLLLVPTACATGTAWPPAPALSIKPDGAPGTLPASVTAEPTDNGRWRCTLRFKPDGVAKTVSLAGTMNDWNAGAMPLAGPDKDGVWSATVELVSGRHQYKFVVDGSRWLQDPQNREGVSDNRGGNNSVLRLGRIAQLTTSTAQVGDGQVEGLALEHRPQTPMYLQLLADHRALFRVRTLAHDVERVAVAVQGGDMAEMTPVQDDAVFCLWEGIAALPAGLAGDGHLHYTFVLTDGKLTATDPTIYGAPVSKKEVFRTPDWAKHAVWYQIFPDRFRNGNPANDRDPVRPWTSEWFALSPWEVEKEKAGDTFYKWFVYDRQYGGDIDGLEAKLPYLRELGVTALYLNPVFESESNHKYNATNYVHIDQHFGTKGDYEPAAAKEDLNDPNTWVWTESDLRFLKFLKAAHAQGFKVIIDGVFNHVGTLHPAFQDVKKNGQKSKYADWFNVTSWEPFKYEGWFGHDALPVFKKSPDGLASTQVRDHIYHVTRRWMAPNGNAADGIDGWRLDVPNEIPAPFWVGWRQLVKSINPEAYIVGEIWDRADMWLAGQHFDAVMNYEFSRPLVAWAFNRKLKISVSELDHRLRDLRVAYPLEATLVLQNLMDSHDTDRVASMVLNPDRTYNEGNRPQQEGIKYDNAKPGPKEYARVRLTALVQMTYVGAPMVYYGDEVGMWGAADPTGRKPMLWEDLQPYEKPEENFVMRDLLAYYRQVIALRNAHAALRTGEFRTLLADDTADVWAFLRKDRDEQLVVVLNGSDEEHEVTIPLPVSAPNKWRLIFDASAAGAGKTPAESVIEPQDHKLKIKVPPVAGVVLQAATPK